MGLFTVASWNCATLQPLDRQRFLHDRSTFVGKANIVLLQEIHNIYQLNNNTNNTLMHLHAAFKPRPHIALLAYDTGILICHTDWIVEEVSHTNRSTYARICIPDSSPAIGDKIRLLHVWSIHAPPSYAEFSELWGNDVAGLHRLQPTTLDRSSAAIVSGDWNVVPCLYTDVYPPNTPTNRLPSAPFDLAQLSDVFRVLHPGHLFFTRHHIIQGDLLSSHRLDSIWISCYLVPLLLSAHGLHSPSDHAAVSVTLKTSAAAHLRKVGPWRLHREVHLHPEFAIPMQDFSDNLHTLTSIRQAPIAVWCDVKHRIRSASLNFSIQVSNKLDCQKTTPA